MPKPTTIPTGRVNEHVQRAPKSPPNVTGKPPVKTISTGRVGDHVTRQVPPKSRPATSGSPLGSKPSQHVQRPSGAPTRHPGGGR